MKITFIFYQQTQQHNNHTKDIFCNIINSTPKITKHMFSTSHFVIKKTTVFFEVGGSHFVMNGSLHNKYKYKHC